MSLKKQVVTLSSALAVTALTLTGCATNSQVDRKIAEAQTRTDAKIESVASQVEDVQERQRATEARVEEVSREAQEALRRAEEAGVLARGKVLFEQRLSDDRVRFRLNSDQLSADARTSLDEVAQKLKALDAPYFVEIQGHTDSTGAETFNERLGEERAEAVRRYLARQHDIPLVRMSTISYGETLPAVENTNRANRQQNRRVVLVVLQ